MGSWNVYPTIWCSLLQWSTRALARDGSSHGPCNWADQISLGISTLTQQEYKWEWTQGGGHFCHFSKGKFSVTFSLLLFLFSIMIPEISRQIWMDFQFDFSILLVDSSNLLMDFNRSSLFFIGDLWNRVLPLFISAVNRFHGFIDFYSITICLR